MVAVVYSPQPTRTHVSVYLPTYTLTSFEINVGKSTIPSGKLTNRWLGYLPIFNRKYIDSIQVHFSTNDVSGSRSVVSI